MCTSASPARKQTRRAEFNGSRRRKGSRVRRTSQCVGPRRRYSGEKEQALSEEAQAWLVLPLLVCPVSPPFSSSSFLLLVHSPSHQGCRPLGYEGTGCQLQRLEWEAR